MLRLRVFGKNTKGDSQVEFGLFCLCHVRTKKLCALGGISFVEEDNAEGQRLAGSGHKGFTGKLNPTPSTTSRHSADDSAKHFNLLST